MALNCLVCGKSIEQGDYRLIGVEKGTWESQYTHRGTCEAEARARLAPKPAKRKARPPSTTPQVEELTLDAPDPFPEDELPWFGAERRR